MGKKKNVMAAERTGPMVFLPSEEEARRLVEKMRWPNGPVCPHCENAEKIYELKGKKCRAGLYKCAKCRKQFTAKVGTIFEDSHIPLRYWLYAIHAMASSKKGIAAHQIMRTLKVQYRTAWFMMHRLRHAMRDPVFDGLFDGIVEADETYIGPKKVKVKRGRGAGKKQIVFGLVERGGRMRPFHVERVTGKNLKSIIRGNVKERAIIAIDEFAAYRGTLISRFTLERFLAAALVGGFNSALYSVRSATRYCSARKISLASSRPFRSRRVISIEAFSKSDGIVAVGSENTGLNLKNSAK